MNLPTPESIRDTIAQHIHCDYLTVTGDGQHFYATIVSNVFDNQRLIVRHQQVYAALGSRMHSEIHALSMNTYTPTEWEKRNG
jgi:acid stress-induced BolA-like protein IbaG/YrbA